MKKRTFLKWTGAAALAPLARTFGGARPPGKRPNVLIITTDQQAAEALGYRSDPRYLKTPNMDALAAESVVFNRAYTANPICMPARAAMLSGCTSPETGVFINDQSVMDPQKFPTLGKLFSQAGYETAYVGKLHAAVDPDDPASHGFGKTFNMQNDGNGLDAATPAAAREFLEQPHERPWLLFVSFNNPHNICEWARGQHTLPDGSIGEPPPLADCPPLRANAAPPENETDIMALMRRSYHASKMCTPVETFGEKEWREYLWAYYRMIEKVDAQVGDVLNALEESGQAEETLIVFTSDHGDCMGAHRWNQKTVFCDESVRIPFFLRLKGVTRPGTSDHLVNNCVDLLPTLCAFAGVPAPASATGRSLKAAAAGFEPEDPRDCVVAVNRMVQGAEVDGRKPEPNGRMVRSKHWKYCVYDMGERREALFDMDADPGETHNLAAAPEYKTILLQHRNYLRDWCRKCGDTFSVPDRL